ncbi:MAG: DUF2752 domain-containing protein [Bradyrhizobium sp.]|nr:DUF2752 domain-containing protein [Bradyrhizobium sp.]
MVPCPGCGATRSGATLIRGPVLMGPGSAQRVPRCSASGRHESRF